MKTEQPEHDAGEKSPVSPRLCSEVQLFDLCSRERCGYREGRFCSDLALLEKFEAIAEHDDTRPVLLPGCDEEYEDDDDSFGDCYDDGSSADEEGDLSED